MLNTERGILILDPKQLEPVMQKPTLSAPNMEIPIWTIGGPARLPDHIHKLKSVDELILMLRSNPEIPVPTLACSNVKDDGLETLDKTLGEINACRVAASIELRQRLNEKEIGRAWPKDRPPKVFCYCTRFSSVMQYSAKNLLAGFAKNGCETTFYQEPDAISRASYFANQGRITLPIVKAISAFEPDMVLSINFYRDPLLYGMTVPVYTWINDRMDSNLNEVAGPSIGKRDFIGHHCRGFVDLWLDAKFPIEQMIVQPWGYDEDIFYPPSDINAPRDPVVVYVEQNGAQTPQEMYMQLKQSVVGAPGWTANHSACLDAFVQVVGSRFENHLDCQDRDYEQLWADVSGKFNVVLVPALRKKLLHMFSHDVGNRWMRQRPLEELTVAGFPLKLYGNGWEKHPILKHKACGPVKNYKDIPDLYRKAKVVLCLQHETTMIHRSVEATACGAHLAAKELHYDFEPVFEHLPCTGRFFYPSDILPCVSALLNMPQYSAEESRITNYQYKNLVKNIVLPWINSRIEQEAKP